MDQSTTRVGTQKVNKYQKRQCSRVAGCCRGLHACTSLDRANHLEEKRRRRTSSPSLFLLQLFLRNATSSYHQAAAKATHRRSQVYEEQASHGQACQLFTNDNLPILMPNPMPQSQHSKHLGTPLRSTEANLLLSNQQDL
jgi:hypothetical protein